MGGFPSKKKGNLSEKNAGGLREKVRSIQEEMSEMVCERKKESAAYERDMMVFAFKEAEWKQEKKKMREEVKMLRKVVEEKEERIRGMEDCGGGVMVVGGDKSSGGGGGGGDGRGVGGGENNGKEWEVLLESGFLAEQMKEERARRDETVEKWKQLYLAIKVELDDLIQRTHSDSSLLQALSQNTISAFFLPSVAWRCISSSSSISSLFGSLNATDRATRVYLATNERVKVTIGSISSIRNPIKLLLSSFQLPRHFLLHPPFSSYTA